MYKIGIAVYDQPPDRWAIVIAEDYYNAPQVYFYHIVCRANRTWLRTDHRGALAHETGMLGVLHVGDVPTGMPLNIHGVMQNIYSGEGAATDNPTHLPWGPKPWVVRALNKLHQDAGIQLPNCRLAELPALIQLRIELLRHSKSRYLPLVDS